MLPRVDIGEVVLEVMSWQPGFLAAFTAASGGQTRLDDLGVSVAAAVTAHALKVAAGDTDTPMLRASRSWSDGAWQAAEEDLRTRGVLDAAGTLTADGVAFRDRIEALTDARAAQPWLRLGHAGTERLAALLAPVAEAVLSGGTVPMPNPIGLPVAPEER